MENVALHSVRTRRIAQVLLLVAAVAFICFGAYRGEVETVFTKAIRLCLECVGIG